MSVSIHASTQEATPTLPFQQFLSCFNPRLHAGGDATPGTAPHSCKFQSTPPRRRRRNARTYRDNLLVSIHASTQEAT